MVHLLRYPTTKRVLRWERVADTVGIVVFAVLLGSSFALAQQPDAHLLYQGVTAPPGAIGRVQLERGGPLAGYFQPVEVRAPSGASVSMADAGHFDTPGPAPRNVGLLIGEVYRLRVTGIPMAPGVEVFPTIELIDRLYTPEHEAQKFPIPIEFSAEDLELAAAGKYVMRVVYLEDPLAAVPDAEPDGSQHAFDAALGDDPLAVADQLGRPVAIIRMGARIPERVDEIDPAFLFGCPPYQQYPSGVRRLAAPPNKRDADRPARPEPLDQ